MRTVISWAALAVLVCFTTVVAQAAPLQVDLEPGDAAGIVKFSLTNTSDVSVSVLRWDTPFERTLSSDVFRLERRLKAWPLVERAPYIGRDVKRAIPDADQYLILTSGETVSIEIQLHDFYQIREPDRWNVRFLGQIRHERLTDAQGTRARKAPALSALNVVSHESNSVALRMVPDDSYRARMPAFNNCSVQQQADIVAATELAEDYVSTAVSDLQSLSLEQRATSPRYVNWFGAYAESRFDKVSSNYRTIGAVLENEEIRFDCGCEEAGIFAYVFPVRPYDIFLCPQFRAATIDGTDSRAGTIVHELSHFNVVAATDDHVYSQPEAQGLARTDPSTAITNADSYEYFAENTPALDISESATTALAPEFSVLELGTPVTGTVEAGNSVTYQVSDAAQINLSSVSGDADLYLYSDAALAAETCSSLSISVEDVCESFVDGLVYVRVFGYSEATYTLVATGRNTDTPQPVLATPLLPGASVFGSLQEGARIIFSVIGANQVELESLTGDADLYVFDSLEFRDTTLVCVAEAYSSDSTLDRCRLPSPSETYYLLINGFEASDYSLTATGADSLAGADSQPEDDDPTTLSSPATFAQAGSSSGGGGSFDWWGIGLLMLFHACCRSTVKSDQW